MQARLFFFCAASITLGLVAIGNAFADSLFGVGATFPNHIYQAWGKAYEAKTTNKLVYTPIGSGKGIAAISDKKTDFGASDKPLKLDELNQKNLMQFPMIVGGVVVVFNLKGVANQALLLDGNSLAQIYLGKITHWNDPALRALNPTLDLPNSEIIVVTRSDKSGTTFNFTNYLSKVSPDWQTSMGEGLSVKWKVGVSAEGTKGVVSKVAETPNAIGYMDLADAQKKSLNYSKLKNRSNNIVTANASSFAAAAASAKWTAANGYYEILTDTSSVDGWPITAASFILLERTPSDSARVVEVIKFFDWA
ncbi:MAG: phosphate ABC transporter substrate-binding protein PstS, partial [Gallionella sp.]